MAASRRSVAIGLIGLLMGCCAPRVHSQCTINLKKDYVSASPLILGPQYSIIYPITTSSQLTFPSASHRQLYCPGGELLLKKSSASSNPRATECFKGLTFSDPGAKLHYKFDQAVCSKSTPSIATKRSVDPATCGASNALVEVGFQVTENVFQRTYKLCFSESEATTYWSHSTVPSFLGNIKVPDKSLPEFKKGDFFKGIALSTKVYPKRAQRSTFMSIFNNETLVDKYLPESGEAANYFVKGHLVANADKFYPAEQHSTFLYSNALPMWQSVNNGNWKSVEAIVRRTASLDGELAVWTGGVGVLKFKNKAILLAAGGKVPAPRLLYKLVHNEVKREAIVFVTANNPYLEDSELRGYLLCAEYKKCAEQFKHFANKFAGYTYCCLYDDFRESLEAGGYVVPVRLKGVSPLVLR